MPINKFANNPRQAPLTVDRLINALKHAMAMKVIGPKTEVWVACDEEWNTLSHICLEGIEPAGDKLVISPLFPKLSEEVEGLQ